MTRASASTTELHAECRRRYEANRPRGPRKLTNRLPRIAVASSPRLRQTWRASPQSPAIGECTRVTTNAQRSTGRTIAHVRDARLDQHDPAALASRGPDWKRRATCVRSLRIGSMPGAPERQWIAETTVPNTHAGHVSDAVTVSWRRLRPAMGGPRHVAGWVHGTAASPDRLGRQSHVRWSASTYRRAVCVLRTATECVAPRPKRRSLPGGQRHLR
jgi:hypothetical protein